MTGAQDGSGNRHRLALGENSDVDALYAHLYFAPVASLASFSAAQLVEAVLSADPSVPGTKLGPAQTKDGSLCAAQFVVSVDAPHRFDAELSMREPLELQVWPDGSFVVEIEFMGEDVRTNPDAADSIGRVLAEWAYPRGCRLTRVFNDRGRSLPDVWNASFLLLDSSRSVADALEFAQRAIAVAESLRYGGRFVDRLLGMLRSGDVEGLIGTPITAVFQPRSPLIRGDDGDFDLALDVCAFANAPQGGLVVMGLEEEEGRVTAVRPAPLAGGRQRIERALRRFIFPAPEGVHIEAIESGADSGLLLVHVPAQDRVLKPFLVHGTVVDDCLHQQGVTIVERREATIYVQGIAALHSQIAAGRALLGGPPVRSVAES